MSLFKFSPTQRSPGAVAPSNAGATGLFPAGYGWGSMINGPPSSAPGAGGMFGGNHMPAGSGAPPMQAQQDLAQIFDRQYGGRPMPGAPAQNPFTQPNAAMPYAMPGWGNLLTTANQSTGHGSGMFGGQPHAQSSQGLEMLGHPSHTPAAPSWDSMVSSQATPGTSRAPGMLGGQQQRGALSSPSLTDRLRASLDAKEQKTARPLRKA